MGVSTVQYRHTPPNPPTTRLYSHPQIPSCYLYVAGNSGNLIQNRNIFALGSLLRSFLGHGSEHRMDELSEKLIISLQLQDIEEALAARKGKGKQGDPGASNDEFAFDTYRKYLRGLQQDITDRRLARGLGEGVWEDGNTPAKRIIESDSNLALRLEEEGEEDVSSTDSEPRTLASWSDNTSGAPEVAMNEWQARLWLEDQTGVRN